MVRRHPEGPPGYVVWAGWGSGLWYLPIPAIGSKFPVACVWAASFSSLTFLFPTNKAQALQSFAILRTEVNPQPFTNLSLLSFLSPSGQNAQHIPLMAIGVVVVVVPPMPKQLCLAQGYLHWMTLYFTSSPPTIRGSLVLESPAMEGPDLSTWVLGLELDCPTVS